MLKGFSAFVVCMAFAGVAFASSQSDMYRVKYPWYIGASAGYGNTDWDELVSNHLGNGDGVVPIKADSGGLAYSILTGYNFTPYFALEFAYEHFPDTKLYFKPTGNEYNMSFMKSATSAFDLVAKFMVPVFNTGVKAYAGLGPGYMHRDDYDIKSIPPNPFAPSPVYAGENIWKFDAVFVGGFDYNIGQHWLTGVGFKFFTGNGKASSKPINAYFPFVYTVSFTLAYRIPLLP